MSQAPRRAIIGGQAMPLDEARLAVTDEGVARGDGAFETIGVWDGRPFELEAHIDRLAASLDRILLPAPDTRLIRKEVETILDGVRVDAVLRLYVTASGTRVVTLDSQPRRREPRHLVPQPAPWIRPLGEYGPAGAKSMSYLPNMVSTRAAEAAGGDDALLVSTDGWVLEGPTFAVYWVVRGVLHAPLLSLGIVDSISRRTVLGLAGDRGIRVVESRVSVAQLGDADELLVSSSVRDVVAVRRVGERTWDGPTPVRDQLSRALEAARRAPR